MIRYTDKVTFSFIVSQIETEGDDILCVRDGYELIVFKSLEDIPDGLITDFRKYNTSISTFEYHWRLDSTKTEYVFFEERVDEYLRKKESDNMTKVFVLANRTQSKLKTVLDFKS